jgi:acylaminoacyl-peptidase
MAMLDRASDPHVSPDGRYVAWNVRSTDWDENKGVHSLWILDRQNKDASAKQLASKEKTGTSPRWSADGRSLYFISSRSGTAQIWRMQPDGSDVTQVTALPFDINFYKVSPDGRTIVVTQDVYPDCDTLACSKDKADAHAKAKVSGVVYEGRLPRFWDEFEDERNLNLFAVTLSDGAPSTATPLMHGFKIDIPEKPQGSDAAFGIAPDGRSVYFAVRPSGASQGLGTPSHIYFVPIDGSATPRPIDPSSTTADGDPVVSPDGTFLAWRTRKLPTFEPYNAHIVVRTLATGEQREIPINADLIFEGLAWSHDGRTIYALGEDVGQRKIFGIDVASGAVRPLTRDGHAGDIDVGENVIVYTRDALDSPPQVWEVAEGEAPRQLSSVGGEALKKFEFSQFEQFAFPGWNGETVHGYVVKPYDYHEGQKYPVAYLIHGGPHGNFANAWSFRWNPQVWASMGYAVVMVDFHGSSSYGEKFALSILGHWGDRPLEDLRKGWDYALKNYSFLDGSRACALGGSYGGYMVSWIAGAWNEPFKCLVDHDGVFDIRLMAYSTDIPDFQRVQNQGETWSQPEAVERFNPARLVKDWKKPILVVHGGKDYRVPLDQGMGAYTAAQLRGVPSELLYFPDENHWVLKPQNSVLWYATVEKWMGRWLGQASASTPARPAAP